ncbi:MAG TPA: hypothetical protein VMF61_11340, partial [Candidatus Acidoferrales bacterium]|nr:hypothetical protein [Candidatus Acidoferrales bacterium]
MEARHTSLERGLTISFILVIVVVLLFIPLMYYAMKGVTDQAGSLHGTVIRGQLAYAKVASDADGIRAATLEAATNPDPSKAGQRLQQAKD